ncbi:myelin-oligodendrocyte glycoprotein-like [Pholidichthys leucotaenia]
MTKGDSSLVLKDARYKDNGTYECHLTQTGTNHSFVDRDPISVVTLRVFNPHLENITAKPGDNVILPCVYVLFTPVPAVEWTRPDLYQHYVLVYQDGRYDLQGQNPSFRNRVELEDEQMKNGIVSLVLKNVTFTDSGTYQCRIIVRARFDSFVELHVIPPGEDGGSNSLVIGLTVFFVLLVAAAVATVLIFKKCRKGPSQSSFQPVSASLS